MITSITVPHSLIADQVFLFDCFNAEYQTGVDLSVFRPILTRTWPISIRSQSRR